MSGITVAFLAFAAVSVASDVRTRKLPNRLNACGFAAALALQFAAGGWEGLLAGVLGAAAGFAATVPLRAAKAVGGGDVKWFAAAGAFLGAKGVVQLLFLAVALSGAAAVVWLACSRSFRERCALFFASGMSCLMERSARPLIEFASSRTAHRFPFMTPVGMAVFAMFVWNEPYSNREAWLWIFGG